MKKLIVIAALFMATPAAAQWTTGNEWITSARNNETSALVWLRGAHEMLGTMANQEGQQPVICVPARMTFGQIKDMFFVFLSGIPDERHHNAATLYVVFAAEKFPCRNNGVTGNRRS